MFTWLNIACLASKAFLAGAFALQIIAYTMTTAALRAFLYFQFTQLASPSFIARARRPGTVAMTRACWIIHNTYLFVAVFANPANAAEANRLKAFSMATAVVQALVCLRSTVFTFKRCDARTCAIHTFPLLFTSTVV